MNSQPSAIKDAPSLRWSGTAVCSGIEWGEGGAALIKPLSLPTHYEFVRPPIIRLTAQVLGRQLETRERRRQATEPVTVAGIVGSRAKVLADRSVQRHYFIEDAAGNRLWVGRDIKARRLLDALERRRGRQVRLRGLIGADERGFRLDEPVPVQPDEVGKMRPVYKLHTFSARRMERELLAEFGEDAYLEADWLLAERLQLDTRRAYQAQMSAYAEASCELLLNECLVSRQSRRAAFGTARKAEITTDFKALLKRVHSTEEPALSHEAEQAMAHIIGVAIYEEPVKDGLRSARQRAAETVGAPDLAGVVENGDYGAAVHRIAGQALGFTPREDQIQAAVEVLAQLDAGSAARHVLVGDVGYGKSCVQIIAIGAALQAGMRVAVIVPKSVLAIETYDKMAAAFPGERINFRCGSMKRYDPDARLWIGTTGVAQGKDVQFDFVVVDEQQGFSTRQRERLLKPNGHLLEMSATLIARTLNRVLGGVQTKSVLTHCHAKKRFHSLIRIGRQHGPRILASIERNSARGHNTIVCYRNKHSDSPGLLSVEGTRDRWVRSLGERAVFLHGSMDDDTKRAAIERFRVGTGMVLLTTTVVEVGLNLPDVSLVVCVDADYLGRFTLHQLRGRAIREGGRALFVMYAQNEPSATGMQRLLDLQEHTDGFELARLDEMEKGCGDTSDAGEVQRGRVRHPHFNGSRIGARACEQATNALAAEFGKLRSL